MILPQFTKKTIFLVLIFLLFAGGGIVLTVRNTRLIERLDLISSNQNPLIRHLAPTWRSVKKIIDLPYLAVSVFMPGEPLPVYEIDLSKNDRFNLLKNLPDYPRENRLYESFKQSVKAKFRYGSYETDEAKIRYRGVSPNHWNALKKSWQVDLPKDKPLKERAVLRFFIGEDKGWVKAMLWNHLAEKLRIMSPKAEPVELLVNKEPMGVYMLVEGWEESFLERNRRQQGRLFANKNLPAHKPDFFLPTSLSQWYDRFNNKQAGETFPELNYFLSLIGNGSDERFQQEMETILDMDIFLRWTLATVLSGNFHQGNGQNLNFYFNPATGKFEPIFFDASPSPLGESIDLNENRLANRILREDRFRKRFEEVAKTYVNDVANLEDDLAFYDAVTKKIMPAIMRDTTKVPTTFEARQKITKERETYKQNFFALRKMFEKNGKLSFTYAHESYPLGAPLAPDAFASFRAATVSRSIFLQNHPQFVAGADISTVILLPGTYSFTETVIVPKNLRVVIRENTHLLFGPKASFVSYSPVRAQGDAANPITVSALMPGTPWGVLALINTQAENVFRYVHFSGGKDATINGLYFSGMLSSHNADLDFRFGTIKNAGADDGIHVLQGKALIQDSLFVDNSSDSIDVDFASEGSRIASNRFLLSSKKDLNGDAMDLSFSDLLVKDNIVERCSDKGVSVGESSKLLIEHNTIKECAYGVAVKDRSEALIKNNTFEHDEIAIGLYRKKPHFISGGSALLINNQFIENKTNVSTDTYSHYSEQP